MKGVTPKMVKAASEAIGREVSREWLAHALEVHPEDPATLSWRLVHAEGAMFRSGMDIRFLKAVIAARLAGRRRPSV